jgi:hypothetical protein
MHTATGHCQDGIPRIKVIRTKVVPFVAALAVSFTGDGIESGAVMTARSVAYGSFAGTALSKGMAVIA